MMLTREVPGVRVNIGALLPVVFTMAALILFLGRLALRAQQQPTVTGAAALVGERARTRTALFPGAPGQVDVHGEIWRASSSVPIGAGEFVRVRAIDGLTLTVDPDSAPLREGDSAWKA
jgi:membrane-bound serine protease (ClpP class)